MTFTIALHPDYIGFEYQWARNPGDDLTDGPTSSGSIISGANTPILTIHNVGASDVSSYLCRVQIGSCGHSWSQSAQLTIDPNCACPTDTNGDGMVNVSDLLAVISAWGPCADPNNCPADVNDDDVVNVADLLAVISASGTCP